MTREHLMSCILNSFPFPIMFVDRDFVIRYMNREAVFRYETLRGMKDLIGKSVFGTYLDESDRDKMIRITDSFKKNGPEVYAGVTDRNMRKYYVPVRDKEGNYIGYYERLEFNRVKE